MLRNLAIIAVVLIATAVATATPFDLCAGGSPNIAGATAAGVTITPGGGSLACKSKTYVELDGSAVPQAQVWGLGVSGATPGEIDALAGQSILFTFSKDVVVEEFEITLLYNGPEFGDPRESGSVLVTYADLSTQVFTFQTEAEEQGNSENQHSGTNGISWEFGAFGATTGSAPGSAVNRSPMSGNNAGWFLFYNFPFGSVGNTPLAVKSLLFTANVIPRWRGNNSDYSIKSLVFTEAVTEPIPEPATYAFVGIGLLGLAMWRRKRSS